MRQSHRSKILDIAKPAETRRRSVGATRVAHVSLGVDLETFHPRLRDPRGEREMRVVYVGRLAPEHNLALLIQVWPEVERRTNARLTLLGDGPLAARLQAQTRDMRVECRPFTLDRARVASLLAHSDLLVSPGSHDTFGLTAVEAMACGTPVVSCDRGGAAEHVRRSGVGSLFVDGSAASLADTLIRTLGDTLPDGDPRARAYVEQYQGRRHAIERVFPLPLPCSVQAHP